MAFKVFTNGSVLQASEVNENLMRQSVSTFSNAAARTAAITSPSEGMLTYTEDNNLYATWNGSAWASPFGLTLIAKQTIGTSVSSVTVSNVFSDTYDAYKIIVSGGVNSAADAGIRLKLGTASNGHDTVLIYGGWTGGSVANSATSNAGFCQNMGTATLSTLAMNCDVINPFLTKHTFISSATFAETNLGGIAIGRQSSNTSFTSFDLIPATGAFTGGTIFVYGYRKAS